MTLVGFDFDSPALQDSAQREWFGDLGVSYPVGFYGFSLWLAGLTVVVGAAAIGFGAWVGRDRARAYYGLMLFLIGAVVGVFASQDLLLFYVFFEAMLIPIYVLVGVWGGPNRISATVTFVIYTMAGSLLMLASIVVFGLSQGTFSLIDSGTSGNDWVFLGFLVAFAVKAPLLPFHGWLRTAYTEAPPEVAALLSGVVSKAAVFGLDLDRAAALPRAGRELAHGRARARRGRPRLRLAARVPPAGRPRRDRVLVDGADEPDRARDLRRRTTSASTARSSTRSATASSRRRCSCSPRC